MLVEVDSIFGKAWGTTDELVYGDAIFREACKTDYSEQILGVSSIKTAISHATMCTL